MADAETLLRKLVDAIAAEQGYLGYQVDVTPVSTGGANYTTALFTVVISEPTKDDLQLFAKIAIMNEKVRSDMPVSLYEIENFFYTELAKKYEHMQNKNNVPAKDRLVLAKYYGGSTKLNEETIVLENLEARGFTCHDRMKSIDWPYAAKAVEALAKYHALSMAFAEDNPEEFHNIFEKHRPELKRNEGHIAFSQKVIAHALGAVKSENKGKLQKFLGQSNLVEKMMKMTDSGRKAVLLHGDYRASNLMHRENQDGSIEIIPVDLQTLRGGCGISDLMYFIFTGSDQEFRARHYTQLLDHYYNHLSSFLKALDHSPEDIYSREDYDDDLDKLKLTGLLMAVFVLPIVTVETSEAPNAAEGGGLASLVAQHTSDLYTERLNGIVDDYVQWGII